MGLCLCPLGFFPGYIAFWFKGFGSILADLHHHWSLPMPSHLDPNLSCECSVRSVEKSLWVGADYSVPIPSTGSMLSCTAKPLKCAIKNCQFITVLAAVFLLTSTMGLSFPGALLQVNCFHIKSPLPLNFKPVYFFVTFTLRWVQENSWCKQFSFLKFLPWKWEWYSSQLLAGGVGSKICLKPSELKNLVWRRKTLLVQQWLILSVLHWGSSSLFP